MGSVMAVISKAVFEKQAPKGLSPGGVWPLDRYVSKTAGLRVLADGGALFLVTVRPPDERLWLVAVLESPRFDGEQWTAAPNVVPVRDATPLLPKLRFTTGKGIAAQPGKLGMSLQTPRELTDEDVAELRGGAPAPTNGASAVANAATGVSEVKAPRPRRARTNLADRLTLDAWRTAGPKERVALTRDVVEGAGGTLEAVRVAGEEEVPVFLHEPTQALFHLVPGGTWTLGFSPEESDALYRQYRGWWEADTDDAICEDRRQLPEPHRVALPAFLLASRPFNPGQTRLLMSDERAVRDQVVSEGRKIWRYDQIAKLPADKYLQYLEEVEEGTLAEEQFEQVEARLLLRGLRLPTHDEWEAAARAGGHTPFPAGTQIPKYPRTGVNRFGFVDMGAWPEVVAGLWSIGSEKPARALRGGAAMCYPGQDCGEWTLMLCALRTSAESFEGMLHVRPLMEIA